MSVDSIRHKQIMDDDGYIGWVTDVLHHDEIGHAMSSRLHGVHTKQSAEYTLDHYRATDARIAR